MKKFCWLPLLLFLSLWAILPLFHQGFFPMHDDEQIARLYELHQAIVGGQFPPRWVSNLGFGFGYPFYNFYPPLVYYLGEVFHLMGFSLIISTKIVMGLGFLLSGIFAYLLAREFLGSAGALTAAIFYIYAPYHSVDLYVRGALAEFFTFVFLPAVFWSTSKLIKHKNKQWLIINSLFLAGLLLSHNFIVLIFLPFYFAFVAYLISSESKKKKALLILFCSGFLFLGLTGYFWLPALLEKKYTLVDTILTRELANYKLHFVYLRQFWNSPWGYGGSVYGLEDGLSFQVGKFHLILSFFAGVLGFFLSARKKKNGFFLLFSFLLFGGSLFMSSFRSQFLWDKFKPLWYLQFPWRFLIFAVLFSSLLSGGLIDYLVKRVGWKKFEWVLVSITFVLLIFLNGRYFKPAAYFEVDDRHYTSEKELKWRVSKMSFEFVPLGVATTLSDIGTTQLDISEQEIARGLFQILSGDLMVKEIRNVSHEKIFEVEGSGELRVNVYNFPGWKAFVDGKKVRIRETGKLNLITLDFSGGRHQVKIVFTNTPIRTLANLISLFSLVGLFFILKRKYLKKCF